MKVKFLFISLLVALNLSALDIDKLEKYNTTYDKNVNPHKDLAVALQKVKKSGKKVLLLVGGDWCKWCGTFDNFLDDHEAIAREFYGSFEVVRVYYGKNISEDGKSLLKQFPPLKATPHFYLLDKNATLLKSIPSEPLERGYGYNKHKVIDFIHTNK